MTSSLICPHPIADTIGHRRGALPGTVPADIVSADILNDRPDGACAMLDEENRCRIYPVRPEKCQTFPYEWTNAESANYCPGLTDQK